VTDDTPSVTTPPTRGRLRQARDETRSLILDAAEKLLRERPYREISVDEIMRSTGYGRTVFYRHFTGMPDLVLAVLARVLPEFAAAQQAFMDAANDDVSADDMRGFLRPAVVHWQRNGPLLRAMRDAAVYDEEIEVIVEQALMTLREMTVQALHRRRRIGKLQDADLDQVAAALAALTQRYLLETYGKPGSDVPVDLATETLGLVWVAILEAP
jgi:AcrR family transcriptional regulator